MRRPIQLALFDYRAPSYCYHCGLTICDCLSILLVDEAEQLPLDSNLVRLHRLLGQRGMDVIYL